MENYLSAPENSCKVFIMASQEFQALREGMQIEVFISLVCGAAHRETRLCL